MISKGFEFKTRVYVDQDTAIDLQVKRLADHIHWIHIFDSWALFTISGFEAVLAKLIYLVSIFVVLFLDTVGSERPQEIRS